MSVRILKGNDFAGGFETASGNITTKVEGGENIAFLIMRFLDGGAALSEAVNTADVANVLVKRNGKQIVNLTGKELYMLQSFYNDNHGGAVGDDGLMIIPFWFLEGSSVEQKRTGVLPMGRDDVLTIKVTFASGTIECDAAELYVGYTSQPTGPMIRTLTSTNVNYNAAGTDTYPHLDKTDGHFIKAIHLDLGATPGVISEFEVIRNKVQEWHAVAAVNTEWLAMSGYAVQTPYQHLDFLGPERTLTNALSMTGVTQLLLKTTWSTATGSSYKVIEERLEPVP